MNFLEIFVHCIVTSLSIIYFCICSLLYIRFLTATYIFIESSYLDLCKTFKIPVFFIFLFKFKPLIYHCYILLRFLILHAFLLDFLIRTAIYFWEYFISFIVFYKTFDIFTFRATFLVNWVVFVYFLTYRDNNDFQFFLSMYITTLLYLLGMVHFLFG